MIDNKDIPEEYIARMDKTIAAIHDFTRPALPMMREVAIVAYRHLKAQPSPVLPWISVNDQLPEVSEYVLVWLDAGGDDEGIALKGRRLYDGWSVYYADGEHSHQDEWRPVSHWCKIPASPFSKPDPTHTAQ